MRASEDPAIPPRRDDGFDGRERIVDEHGRARVVDEAAPTRTHDEHAETRRHDAVVDEPAPTRAHDAVHDEHAATRRHDVVDDDRAHEGSAVAAGTVAAAGTTAGLTRAEVVAREKERFGGMKLGSAFFGWLTATGTVVLLTALVAGAGAVLGLGTGASADEVADAAAATTGSIGIAGAIAVLVILFVGYLAGGYVAGRMARFSGAKQGLGVWIWAIVIAIVLAIVSAIAGAQWNVLANLDTFPRLPIGEGDLTTLGIVTAVLALVVSLAGAILGGLAGMRFHRRVDREGLGR